MVIMTHRPGGYGKKSKNMKKVITGEKVRETEKAILLNVPCTDQSGHKGFKADKWFPKSALTIIAENTYIVASWKADSVDWSEKAWVAYSVID